MNRMNLTKNLSFKVRDFNLSLLHSIAMIMPFGSIKKKIYRLRGTRIGKNVDISQFVFLEESWPDLITIEDFVDIGPNVTIVTHDSSQRCIDMKSPIYKKNVLIKTHSYIGACVTILPNVTIGEYSIVGAGSVVTKDVPPYTIVAGVPAKIIGKVTDKN